MARLGIATLLLLTLLLIYLPTASAAAGWQWPVTGQVITGYTNGSNPYAGGMHRGIDIGADVGTSVTAAHAGTVTFAGTVGSNGLVVTVLTDEGLVTSYLHLSATSVGKGADVNAGDLVGHVGVTGKRSNPSPHLHFGVRRANETHGYVDPLSLLPASPPTNLATLPPGDSPPISEPVFATTGVEAGPPAAVLAPLPIQTSTRVAAGSHMNKHQARHRSTTRRTLRTSSPFVRAAARENSASKSHTRRAVTRSKTFDRLGSSSATPVLDLAPTNRTTADPARKRTSAFSRTSQIAVIIAAALLLLGTARNGRRPRKAPVGSGPWPSTSPLRSTTSTPSPTSDTRTQRSARTSSRATCVSGASRSSF